MFLVILMNSKRGSPKLIRIDITVEVNCNIPSKLEMNFSTNNNRWNK